MAKTKKNKRQNSDAFSAKKSSNPFNQTKKLNPFEIHLNKEKFKILGRKNKHDRGLPGVSRAKAQKKRKETLGREYLEKHKTNKFKDNRVGRGRHSANDANNDELATARFVAEKMTQYKEKRKNIYNLNDDEMLTHRGQTLEEIEQFRGEPHSEDSGDELDAEFTEATHFGGGDEHDKFDRKTAIDELIADAKRKKAEMAKEKDEVLELTNKLDMNYKALIPVIGQLNRQEDLPKQPQDDYDRIFKEMIFEPRGEVADKLESEEEIKRKEKERLDKLERERLARMRGEDPDDPPKPTHRSADALDDGYMVGSDGEEEPTLAYDINGDINATDGRTGDENLGDDTLENPDDDAKEENQEQASEEEEEGEEEEESGEDSLDDLKYSDTETELEDESKVGTELSIKQKQKQNENVIKNRNKRKPNDTNDEIPDKKRSKAEKLLPMTFEMPVSYEELGQLIGKYSANDEGIVIERMIKSNHPKLDPANKEKMLKLLIYLLQYINDMFTDLKEHEAKLAFKRLDKISPYIYDLIEMNREKSVECLRSVIKEKYDEFKKNTKVYPSLDTLIFFKLASTFFSTSDFRHPIVTPCFIFISHILSRSRPKNRKDLAIGLFLVTMVLEYTSLSKRFLPSAINFLLGIIYLSSYKRPIEAARIIPPFQSHGPQSSLLALSEKYDDDLEETKMLATDLLSTTIDSNFKVRSLNAVFLMLIDMIENLAENVALCFILEPFTNLIDKLDLELYPDVVVQNIKKIRQSISFVNSKKLSRLVAIEKKPKALRLMEPKIVAVHDDKRRPKLSQEKEMRAILNHKIKRETKGAIREIRRDNEFLAKVQLKKQIQSDQERKEKVRKIYAEASIQQGELNALSRSKKKNKF